MYPHFKIYVVYNNSFASLSRRGGAHNWGHSPIPAVSTSSRCAAVPYGHRGSAVRRDGEIIIVLNHQLKRFESR